MIAFTITPGRRFARAASGARTLLADAAYDSNAFRTFLESRETTPVIKQNPTRKNVHPFDKEAYKGRNIIERSHI